MCKAEQKVGKGDFSGYFTNTMINRQKEIDLLESLLENIMEAEKQLIEARKTFKDLAKTIQEGLSV